MTPPEVWQNVIAERFLVRLCSSPYHSYFVLKGGTLKDFHYLYTLVSTETINRQETKEALSAVFNHRKTPLQLPIRFDDSALEALRGKSEKHI